MRCTTCPSAPLSTPQCSRTSRPMMSRPTSSARSGQRRQTSRRIFRSDSKSRSTLPTAPTSTVSALSSTSTVHSGRSAQKWRSLPRRRTRPMQVSRTMDRMHPNEGGSQQRRSRPQKSHSCVGPGLPFQKSERTADTPTSLRNSQLNRSSPKSGLSAGVRTVHVGTQKRSLLTICHYEKPLFLGSCADMPTAMLADVSRYQARRAASDIALEFEGAQTTFMALDLASNRVANGLIASGINPQSRIAILDKNSDTFFEVLLGAAKANAVLVPINARLTVAEISFILRDANAEVLFLGEAFAAMASELRGEPLKEVVVLNADYREWRDAPPSTDPA